MLICCSAIYVFAFASGTAGDGGNPLTMCYTEVKLPGKEATMRGFKVLAVVAFLFLLILAIGCTCWGQITGSGKLTTKDYSFADFSRILADSSAFLTVSFTTSCGNAYPGSQ